MGGATIGLDIVRTSARVVGMKTQNRTKAQLEARITELTRQVDKLHAENVALKRTLKGIGKDMDNGVIVSAGDITTEDYRKTVIGP